MIAEGEFIAGLRQRAKAHPAVFLGIGDDAALIAPNGAGTLITADMLMDGVHFRVGEVTAERIGRKALAVNLSDIAAMGGRPQTAFVALALPRQTTGEFAAGIMAGILSLAGEFDVALAGGDTNVWEGPLVIAITVTGQPHAHGPVLRSGALPGDVIFVTGPLGGSLAGRHLDFTPRVREAERIVTNAKPTAMIDISDGLATDLRHILIGSGCGAVLDRAQIPLTSEVAQYPQDDALRRALTDGEDFELCFTVPPERATAAVAAGGIAIGRCIAGEGLHWGHGLSSVAEIPWLGYQHS